MIKQFLIFFLLFSVACFGQDDKKGTIKVKKVETNTKSGLVPIATVDQVPFLINMNQFLQKKLKYPQAEKENEISGTVIVTFVVETDGKITNASILKGVSAGLDKEALRVVQMMPNWVPAKKDGKEVRVQFDLPINFRIK